MTVIQPGTSFVYSVLVPSNHPSGVYWFYAPPAPAPIPFHPVPSLPFSPRPSLLPSFPAAFPPAHRNSSVLPLRVNLIAALRLRRARIPASSRIGRMPMAEEAALDLVGRAARTPVPANVRSYSGPGGRPGRS